MPGSGVCGWHPSRFVSEEDMAAHEASPFFVDWHATASDQEVCHDCGTRRAARHFRELADGATELPLLCVRCALGCIHCGGVGMVQRHGDGVGNLCCNICATRWKLVARAYDAAARGAALRDQLATIVGQAAAIKAGERGRALARAENNPGAYPIHMARAVITARGAVQ